MTIWLLFRRLASSSLPALLSHLGSSTIFLLLVLIVLLAGRRRLTASARFFLALIGILKSPAWRQRNSKKGWITS